MKSGTTARLRACAFAIVCTISVAAWAKPTVAVAPFRGPSVAQIEVIVQRALKPYATILSPHRYAVIAKQLVAEGGTAEDVAAVAHELPADFVITGTVKLDGKDWTLTVSVREGATGKARDRLRYPLGGPRVSNVVLSTLYDEIITALNNVVNAPPVEPMPSRHDKKPPFDVIATTPVPTPVPTPAPAPKPAPPPNQRPRWAHWFELDAGISITSRTFSTNIDGGPRFTGPPVAGIHLDLSFFPLTPTWRRLRGVFSGLGLGVTVDKPFWQPTLTAKNDPTQAFATSELRVEGGLRWKITLYKPMPRPQLTLFVQGGLHEFTFVRPAANPNLVAVPDVKYVYASLGARLSIHFAEWSWVWVQFLYHIVSNAGPIQAHDNYGLAYTNGFRVAGGLDFLAWRGIHIGANGFYERFTSTFGYDTNAVRIANNSSDAYFGGMLVFGYVF
ncbi:MAG: hypothetical protein ABI321_11310 [Polyangia bacterium]